MPATTFQTGRWDEAEQLAEEASQVCEAHGYQNLTWPCRFLQVVLAAAKGDDERVENLADEIVQWAGPRGIRVAQFRVWQARGLAALGRGDFEEAYQQASRISPPGTLASHVSHALFVLMDLVEAAVRADRQAEAAAHVAAMQQANLAGLSSRLALVVGASAAMVAPDDHAVELFDAALALPGIERWQFDLARVRLAVRRTPPTPPGDAGGTGAARRRARDLRTARGATLGGPRERGASGYRTDQAARG